jgi:hypothetical protein
MRHHTTAFSTATFGLAKGAGIFFTLPPIVMFGSILFGGRRAR